MRIHVSGPMDRPTDYPVKHLYGRSITPSVIPGLTRHPLTMWIPASTGMKAPMNFVAG